MSFPPPILTAPRLIDATCKAAWHVRTYVHCRGLPSARIRVRRKVNVCADNGDDGLESDLTSLQKLKLHGITDLIRLLEQAP